MYQLVRFRFVGLLALSGVLTGVVETGLLSLAEVVEGIIGLVAGSLSALIAARLTRR